MAPGFPRMAKDDQNRWGVLLLAHGAPERVEDVPEYLARVAGGRPVREEVVKEVVRRYALIGGGSPLLKHTTSQANALAKRLGVPVYIGMRNWKPLIREGVCRIKEDGIERVVALCLAPQNSRTSTGLYRQHFMAAVSEIAPSLRVDFIESWHNHPLLIEAFSEKMTAVLARARAEAGARVPVIFTAHSVPTRTISDGDPYEREVRETAELVARAIESREWCVGFQSQGMTREPWLGPTVESHIARLAQVGRRNLLIAPVGFVANHLEILYDIDVAFRDYAAARGVRIWRSESLNESPLLIEALAALVTSRIARQRHAGSL